MSVYTKTLLLDFSNIGYASYYVMKGQQGEGLNSNEEKFDYWRFLMMSMLKKIKVKHQPTELVICADSVSWRRAAFQYYKAKRDDLKKDADFDYQYFVENMELFLNEIAEALHYKVVKVKGAEADDIIGVLAQELSPVRDKIIIASNDKDFKQLVKGNIHLYNIREEKFLTVENPKQELIFLLLNGDAGDGVPNVRSDDDVFVDSGKRQKPCGAKQITKILEEGIKEYCEREGLTRNFARNRRLIELSRRSIPNKIWTDIMEKYNSIPTKPGSFKDIMMYLSRHQLRSLIPEANLYI